MLIFDDEAQPIIIDSIYSPVKTDHMWVLDLTMMDFTLSPLLVLEEAICPSVQVQLKGFEFILPAYWNILVYDRETQQLDVVEISEAAGREFTAFIYGPHKHQVSSAPIYVTNYFLDRKNTYPTLNKHQMLCHPINANEWVLVGPSDGFNKYLKDKNVEDLVGY